MITKLALGGALVALSATTAMAQLSLEQKWSILPGDANYPFLANDNLSRGLAYNPTTDHLLVVSRTGGVGVHVLEGATGAVAGTLNVTGIAGGTFAANMIGVASDGAIYAANLTTGTTTAAGPVKIYRWANESAVPTLVYEGNPLGGANNGRFGDSLDIRGEGASTQILLGSRANQQAVILSANDATATGFTASVVNTTAGAVGNGTAPFGLGAAFGAGDTLYGTGLNIPLRRFSIDGTVLNEYDTAVVPGTVVNIGLNNTGTLMGAINALAATDEFLFYDVSNPSTPVLLDTEVFPVNNPNSNGVGSVDFGGGMVFALDANNGIVAFSVVPEPGTWALLATGALALFGFRSRSRRS